MISDCAQCFRYWRHLSLARMHTRDWGGSREAVQQAGRPVPVIWSWEERVTEGSSFQRPNQLGWVANLP